MDLSSSSPLHRDGGLASRPFESLLGVLPRRTRLLVCVAFLAALLVFHDYILPQASYHSLDALQAQVARRRGATQHQVRDGLLYADQYGEHPISYLIRQAQSNWEDKVARQSKTLVQATKTYGQRYGREPPPGFDKWFAWAQEHNVILVDEYDKIDRDIAPFLAFPPRVLQQRAASLASDPDNYYHQGSFTINIHNGRLIDVTGPFADSGRAREFARLIRPVAEYLPDLQFTIWAHDTPIIHASGDKKAELLGLQSRGQYMTKTMIDDTYQGNAGLVGWEAFCPPSSPMRRAMAGDIQQLFSTRSFVSSNQTQAIDFCNHPSYLNLHSLTANYGLGPSPVEFWPLFSMCKTSLFSDLVVTPLEQYDSTSRPNDPPWGEKTQNKMLWRGSTTGSRYDRLTMWRPSQRTRLNHLTNLQPGSREIMFAGKTRLQGNHPVMKNVTNAAANSKFFDVAFTGEPVQCAGDGTCEALKRDYRFESNMNHEQANDYRYVIDVDGNGWSGRFHRLMSSNAAVLKSTAFEEWWIDHIEPWYHYIPVKLDYSDLHDTMAYFLGDPVTAEHSHDEAGQLIGQRGKEWALSHWRTEDMQAYMFRLLLEYARLLRRS